MSDRLPLALLTAGWINHVCALIVMFIAMAQHASWGGYTPVWVFEGFALASWAATLLAAWRESQR